MGVWLASSKSGMFDVVLSSIHYKILLVSIIYTLETIVRNVLKLIKFAKVNPYIADIEL